MDLLCFFSVLCLLCLCARLFICALWSPAGKGLTSWLPFVGGGGTLIFSHIRRLGPFFWVQNSEFKYFLGFSKKMNIFLGYEDCVDFFWGVITKLG